MWVYGIIGLSAGMILSYARRRLLKIYDARAGHAVEIRSSDVTFRPIDSLLVLVTGASFAYIWQQFGPSIQTAIVSVHTSVLLLIFALDLTHRWVPNVLVFPTALFAVGASLATGHPPFARALLGGIGGFSFFYMIAAAYPGALGAGDVKLAGLIGLMTGFPNVITALSLGILSGGLVAAALLILGMKTRKSYIPYAPFLTSGALYTLVSDPQIMSRLSSLYK